MKKLFTHMFLIASLLLSNVSNASQTETMLEANQTTSKIGLDIKIYSAIVFAVLGFFAFKNIKTKREKNKLIAEIEKIELDIKRKENIIKSETIGPKKVIQLINASRNEEDQQNVLDIIEDDIKKLEAKIENSTLNGINKANLKGKCLSLDKDVFKLKMSYNDIKNEKIIPHSKSYLGYSYNTWYKESNEYIIGLALNDSFDPLVVKIFTPFKDYLKIFEVENTFDVKKHEKNTFEVSKNKTLTELSIFDKITNKCTTPMINHPTLNVYIYNQEDLDQILTNFSNPQNLYSALINKNENKKYSIKDLILEEEELSNEMTQYIKSNKNDDFLNYLKNKKLENTFCNFQNYLELESLK